MTTMITTTTTTGYAQLTEVTLDLKKVYFRPTADDLQFQTIYGMPAAEGKHDLQPLPLYDPEGEYWYAVKDGRLT